MYLSAVVLYDSSKSNEIVKVKAFESNGFYFTKSLLGELGLLKEEEKKLTLLTPNTYYIR